MKKLYYVEHEGKSCFVIDTDNGTNIDAAAAMHCPDGAEIVNIDEIESVYDIPVDWEYKEPLGAKEVYGKEPIPDCEGFFHNRFEAETIANLLKKDDYDLESTFVEDLQKAMNEVI